MESGDGYYVESAEVSMINGGVILVEYKVLKNNDNIMVLPADIINPDDLVGLLHNTLF